MRNMKSPHNSLKDCVRPTCIADGWPAAETIELFPQMTLWLDYLKWIATIFIDSIYYILRI